MEKHEKARELAMKLMRKANLTEEEWLLLLEAIKEETEVMEEQDRRKELH